jgi:hypothetical protein
MDPITAAIVAALAAGLTEVGKNAVMDTYTGLKSLLKKKFGEDSKVVKAKADQDPELVQKAQELLNQIKSQPGGEGHIQSIIGNYNAMVSGSGSASVNVNHPKDA